MRSLPELPADSFPSRGDAPRPDLPVASSQHQVKLISLFSLSVAATTTAAAATPASAAAAAAAGEEAPGEDLC